MKKIIATIITVILLFTTLFTALACGSNNDPGEEFDENGQLTKKVTLTWLHIWPEHKDSMNKIASDFMAANNNVLIKTQTADYSQVLTTINRAWMAGNMPDVFFYWTQQTEKLVNSEAVMAMDLSADFEDETYYKSFLNDGAAADVGRIAGKYYNVPFRATGNTLIYNKTLLEQKGLTMPDNLEDFETVCKAFVDAGIIPIGTSGDSLYQIYWALLRYVEIISDMVKDENYPSGRIRKYDPNFNPSYEIEATQNANADMGLYKFNDACAGAIEKMRTWTQAGFFPENATSKTEATVISEFLTGKYAMICINNNSYSTVMKAFEEKGWETGASAIPAPNSIKDQAYVSGGYDGFSVSSTTKKQITAKKFLDYLTSIPVMQQFADAEGSIMARKGVTYSDAKVAEMAAAVGKVGSYEFQPDYKVSDAIQGVDSATKNYWTDKTVSTKPINLVINSRIAFNADLTSTVFNKPPVNQWINWSSVINMDSANVTAYRNWLWSDLG